MNIQNARLIAAVGAPATGDVNVDVIVRNTLHEDINAILGTTHLADLGDVVRSANQMNTGVTPPVITHVPFVDLPTVGDTGNWTGSVLVARRGTANVEVTARDAVEGLSGTRSNEWQLSGIDREWLQRRYQSIRLAETAPNTLFSSSNTYEFRIVQEGARFENAEVRTYSSPDGGQDRNEWRAIDNHYRVLPALTELQRDTLTITTRPMANSASRFSLDVRFQIITEPGFEARNGNEVEVRVTGPGGVDEIVTIALITDPVRVLPTEVVTFSRDNFGVLVPTSINNVTFQELEAGTLRIGDTITPVTVPVMDGRRVTLTGVAATALNIAMEPVVNAESGLVLRRVGDSNTFTVERVSHDAPATITFTGLSITGALLPTVDYHVELISNRFTRTSIGTGEAIRLEGDRGGTTELPREDIRFAGLNYTTLVAQVEGAQEFVDEDGPGQGTGLGTGGGLQVENLRFWVGMSAIGAVENPFRFVDGAEGLSVAMVALRGFAYLIGGDDNISYTTTATGHVDTVTLTGVDVLGSPVSIHLTIGSNMAVVNGMSVDIASFAVGSGPAGSVRAQIIEGRTFLPLRFVAQAFGYVVDGTSAWPVIELR